MKKFRLCFITLLFSFIGAKQAHSQVANYVFSQNLGSYVPIDLGSAFTSYGNDLSDDDVFLVNIGFNFYYNGAYYNQAYLNSNGFIYFSSPWTTSNYTPLSSGIDNLVISPCGDDLQAQVGAGIISLTTGVPGNQVTTIEWINYHHWNQAGNYNFQIKLFENKGRIEFCYGLFSSPGTNFSEVGLLGVNTLDFKNRSTLSDWSSTTAGSNVSDFCLVSSSVLPPPGLTFVFEPVNYSIETIVNPAVPDCYTNSENIKISVRNNTDGDCDLSQLPILISGSNAITNPTTFPSMLVNAGVIPAQSSVEIPFFTGFDMTLPGNYEMTFYLSSSADFFTDNDTIIYTFNSVPSGGNFTPLADTICAGHASILKLNGSNGLVQWQHFDGLSWINEAGPGSNSIAYSVAPTVDIQYRALACGSAASNTETIFVTQVSAPVTTGDVRCGPGTVTLSATGSTGLKWFKSGSTGAYLTSGPTYSPLIMTTSSFVVGNTKEGPNNSKLKVTEVGLGSEDFLEIQNLSSEVVHTKGWKIGLGDGFDVNDLSSIVYAMPDSLLGGEIFAISDMVGSPNYWGINIFWGLGGTGWVALLDHAGIIRDFVSWGWPAENLALLNTNISGYPVSLNNFDWAGNGVDPALTTNSVSIQRSGSSDSNNALDFVANTSTLGTQNSGLSINVEGSCVSSLSPVTGVVTPSDTIIANLSSTYLCGGESSTINVTSLNGAYSYSWLPVTGLNNNNTPNVVASPTTNTTYTITAIDGGTGCQSITTAAITVNQTPPAILNISASPPTLCLGDTALLAVQNSFTNPATIGDGILLNASTNYPSVYGVSFAGSRHQMLIKASELTAAGFQPGPINWIYFFVEAMNGGWYVDNFNIKIGHTALNSMTSFQSGLTQVYYNAGYLPSTGWNGHHLDTQFSWDGTSNLIVETCFDSFFFYVNGNPSMRQSPTPFISTISSSLNSGSPCVDNTISGTWAQRPNMRFERDFNLVFTWSPPATLSNAAIPNPLAFPSTTTIYSVNIFDNLTSCASTQSITVPVGNNVPQPAGAVVGPDTICQGETGIEFSVPLVVNATGYFWTLPPGATIVSAPADSNWIKVDFSTTAVSGIVSVHGVNSCGSVLNGAPSPDLPVTLNPLPGPAATITGPSTVCSGLDSVVFSGTLISNADYYQWQFPSGVNIIGGDSTLSVIVKIQDNASSGNIILKGINACGEGLASPAFALTVTPPLVFSIYSSTGSFIACPGDSITLGLSPACNGCNHLWTPSAFILDSLSSNPEVGFQQNVTVEVQTSDSLGCAGSGSQFISVGALPLQPAITQSGDTLYSSPATTYQWYLDGNLISGATSGFLVISANGNYTVEITQGANICSNASDPFFAYWFGIGTRSLTNQFSVSPNPFSENTSLKAIFNNAQSLHIEIFTLTGQKIYEANESCSAGLNIIPLPGQNIWEGSAVLLVKILTKDEIQTFLISQIR